MGYDIAKTPDYSPLVVHFTKDKKFVRNDLVSDGHALHDLGSLTARERLLSILKTKIIHTSPMPFLPNNAQAVCFTECIWDSLTLLSTRYSSYGVVVNKRLIFKNGGGPALYVRGDTLKKWTTIPAALEPLITPFDPEGVIKPGVILDFLDEREWRLPCDLCFEYSDLEYVIVGSIKDAVDIVHEIGAANLPQEKVIPIEVYKAIKSSWGVR
jgi:hypothetical protein